MRNTPLPVYLTLEEYVVAGLDIPFWEYSSYTESLGLERALSGIWQPGSPPEERTYARANSPEPPQSDYGRERIPIHLLPTMLTPGAKKVLDTLFDWPWLFLPDLRGILGVSGSRLSQLTKPLGRTRTAPLFANGRGQAHKPQRQGNHDAGVQRPGISLGPGGQVERRIERTIEGASSLEERFGKKQCGTAAPP